MNYELSFNHEAMYHGAVNAGVQYLLKYKNIRSLIIGVSGGIDSAIGCMLARAACDKLMRHKVTLIGRSIAIDSNTQDEIKRAKEVGKSFCDAFQHVDLTEQYKLLRNRIIPENIITHEQKVRAGNIKARLRMTYLYDLAAIHNGLVLSNDNLTEHMLGFWTLHGDVGDFGFIQNLWKTEVYGLAEWWINNAPEGLSRNMHAAIQSCIDAVPTDGLGITDSDLDQLLPDGYISSDGPLAKNMRISRHRQGYRQVDDTLIGYVFAHKLTKHNSVIKRHLRTEFKRDNPFNVDRKLLIP